LVKVNYQITINGLTKHQIKLSYNDNNKGTEKQHFSEHVSPFRRQQLVLRTSRSCTQKFKCE
jgi:hypothetical protein